MNLKIRVEIRDDENVDGLTDKRTKNRIPVSRLAKNGIDKKWNRSKPNSYPPISLTFVPGTLMGSLKQAYQRQLISSAKKSMVLSKANPV